MQNFRSYVIFALRYAFAIAVVALVTFFLSIMRGWLSTPIIALLYLLPVVLSTATWGLVPGVLTSLSAFLAFNYFFIPPYHTLLVHQVQDLLALIVFLVVAVVISQLLGRAQAGIQAAMTREREATQLYELSTALSGLQDVQAMARTLGDLTLDAFHADQVEISIVALLPKQPATIVCPEGSSHPPGEPQLRAPLSTARGQQGTIQIWRKDSPLTYPERRFLQTFISQGALAIEHASLAESGNRAKMLEESDRLKSMLLSSVSHELRTPLATIKASVTSLRSDAGELGPDARKELLVAIEEETDHLNILVGNLLDSSRIEMGALKPQRKWNSLAEIVAGVIKRMHQVIRSHTVVIDIPADIPLVPVDYGEMEQVFTNLISNSVKYAPNNTEIRVSARPAADNHLLVKVSNQGPPVSEEHLARIFEKFYRVTAADRTTGTGLGLSICKGIVEAHGGQIWAENGNDCFIFNFTLPLTREGETPRLPDEPREE